MQVGIFSCCLEWVSANISGYCPFVEGGRSQAGLSFKGIWALFWIIIIIIYIFIFIGFFKNYKMLPGLCNKILRSI